jgi:ribonuclease HI
VVECGELKNPPQGIYKVNWDVAIDSVKRRLRVGIIMRDH